MHSTSGCDITVEIEYNMHQIRTKVNARQGTMSNWEVIVPKACITLLILRIIRTKQASKNQQFHQKLMFTFSATERYMNYEVHLPGCKKSEPRKALITGYIAPPHALWIG